MIMMRARCIVNADWNFPSPFQSRCYIQFQLQLQLNQNNNKRIYLNDFPSI